MLVHTQYLFVFILVKVQSPIHSFGTIIWHIHGSRWFYPRGPEYKFLAYGVESGHFHIFLNTFINTKLLCLQNVHGSDKKGNAAGKNSKLQLYTFMTNILHH